MTNVWRDPTGTTALTAQIAEDLDAVLHTLSKKERRVLVLRFGMLDGEVRTLAEVAEALRITWDDAYYTEIHALRMLRHPSRSSPVRHHLLDEIAAGVLNRAREAAAGLDAIVFCPRHGWTARHENLRTCGSCPCRPYISGGPGRPPRYCSDACRQAAYRARRASRSASAAANSEA